MTLSLIAACLWALAGCVTALLPLRRQMLPGAILLAAAPLLLVWIGLEAGPVWALLGLAALVSMFRKPLRHGARAARAQLLGVPE